MKSIYENRAPIIVVVDWILFTLAAVFVILTGIRNAEDIKLIFTLDDDDDRIAPIWKTVLISIVVYVALNLMLTPLLTIAVYGEHLRCCTIWYSINFLLAIFEVIGILVAASWFYVYAFVIQCLVLAYRVYAINVIMSYAATTSPGLVYE